MKEQEQNPLELLYGEEWKAKMREYDKEVLIELLREGYIKNSQNQMINQFFWMLVQKNGGQVELKDSDFAIMAYDPDHCGIHTFKNELKRELVIMSVDRRKIT